jgi:hypothetical protein
VRLVFSRGRTLPIVVVVVVVVHSAESPHHMNRE